MNIGHSFYKIYNIYYTLYRNVYRQILSNQPFHIACYLRVFHGPIISVVSAPGSPKKAHHYPIFTTEACLPITLGVIPRLVPPSLAVH